jgi:outer membrane immunogenic protein
LRSHNTCARRQWQTQRAIAYTPAIKQVTLRTNPWPPGGRSRCGPTLKLQWFGTLRGRAGFAVGGLFFYGTGGLAYGQVSANGAAQITTRAEFQPEASLAPFIAWDTKSTKIGWTAGAGIEGRLSQHWSLKVEYLYLDLGSVDNTVVTPPICVGAGPVCFNVNSGAATFQRSVSDNLIRVGINFRP